MGLVTNVIKGLLHSQGYGVVKLNPIKEREIYHAYYHGDRFECIKGDPLTEDILKGKGWDNQVPEILNSISQEEGIVLEIGANIGASILPHSAQYSHLKFFLYEPVPAFYQLLKNNHQTFNKKKNVQIHNLAFSAKAGETIEINVGLGTAGKTKLAQYQMADTTLKLSTTTLDEQFKDEKVRLIKLDVDGHELSILKGGTNLLSKTHPALFIEFAPRVMSDVGQEPNEMTNFLRSLGYNHIRMWDHDAKLIGDTNDWNQLISEANHTPHYLNILVSLK